MKQFTPETVTIESVSALNVINHHRENNYYAAYIGLDVHKKTIAVAIAYRGRGKAISRAEIANTPKAFTATKQVLAAMICITSYWI